MSRCRCDICGKFRKPEDVSLEEYVDGDGFSLDQYLECIDCMSPSDLEEHQRRKKAQAKAEAEGLTKNG